MKRCPFCAEEIQPAAVVCKHCGRDLRPRHRGTWVISIVLIVLALGGFYLWATSAYSVDLPNARRLIAQLEAEGVITQRTCGPNQAAMPVATWRALPSDHTRRNLLLNLARVCLAEGAPADMMLLDARTGQAFVTFDGSEIRR